MSPHVPALPQQLPPRVFGPAFEAPRFDDAPVRFMMFLGFDDEDISASIKAFPKVSKRPILCTLTENNLKWTVSALLEHLMEEDARVKGRNTPQ